MSHHRKSADHDGQSVHQFDITQLKNVNSIVDQWSKTAVFEGGHLAKAVNILDYAVQDNASIFVGLAGAMIPGGMRKVISQAMRDGFIQALTTTGANITHDIIEAIGGKHVHSVKYKDDFELYERGIDRVYDSYVAKGSFESFENFISKSLSDLIKEHQENSTLILSQSELLSFLGSKISDSQSIVRTAYEMKIPIFVPAISDSVLGLQIWLFAQFNPLVIDSTKDLGKIQDLYHEASSNCALLLGGGVPKNYTLQSALMASQHYKYAVQITLDRVETGGLSGADLEEAKSWGKLEEEAMNVTVISELTIALPIIFAALRERKQERE